MITTLGKNFIKRYLAGESSQMVGAISIGIGNTAAAISDTRMQFEIGRVPVNITQYDFENDRLVFKGRLDSELEGSVYEIGLWTSEYNTASGNQESKIITSFDSETESWSAGSFSTSNVRVGPDGLVVAPAASSSISPVATGFALDMFDYSSDDSIVLAYNVANAFTQTVRVRFRTDSSNYYEYSVSTPAAGYQISTFLKGSATVVGTPTWGDITEIMVGVTSTSGGAASVTFDGLRVEDTDSVTSEYGLIARYVLPSPISKTDGIQQDIEYTLPVTI